MNWILSIAALAFWSAACGQSFGGTISANYQSFDFIAPPAGIGRRLDAGVRLEFDPLFFPDPFNITGTYTFADNITWAGFHSYGPGIPGYELFSARGEIDQSSSVTLDHGVITAWSITGSNGVYFETNSQTGDLIIQANGTSAFSPPHGTWSYRYFSFPVPSPIAGAGLPGVLAIIGLLAWRRRQPYQSE